MWKRIRSNRDPRDTLYSELRKEFDSYFIIAGNAIKTFSGLYPRVLFGCMIALIVCSAALSFTFFRHPEERVHRQQTTIGTEDGLGQISRVSGAIIESIRLRNLVDSLSLKKQLSSADSALLDSTLDRLTRLRKSLN